VDVRIHSAARGRRFHTSRHTVPFGASVRIGQLAEWSTQLAQTIMAWHAAKQRTVTPILIQGPADDAAVLLTAVTPPVAVVHAVQTAVGN
jgi:hypothetical protein